MGVGFLCLYIGIAILAIVGAIILWFITKNIWACVVIVGLFGFLTLIIVLSTIFANKSDNTVESIVVSAILNYSV